MNFSPTSRRLVQGGALLCALWLAGCGSTGPTVPGQLSNAAPARDSATATPPRPSNAATPRDYRRDAARHIYEVNERRIYHGKLPSLLYAIGTLEVNVDGVGKVVSIHWLRAPEHAPEIIKEIERTVLAAAPFPIATKLGRVTYTDTWLWDDEGHFQLDTLSEGQL
jgi:hypothetical protein